MRGTDAVYSYDPHGHVYRTAYVPDPAEAYDIKAYDIMSLGVEATRGFRGPRRYGPPARQAAPPNQMRMLRRHLRLVVEDTTDILEPAEPV
ncbi:hypothetical protein ACFRR7_33065 [Streptomyces sp. NPDC056909]|uniref:hypothetical protein n=1 Tax=Streptomyces sp. NPDC056909 TaxID=3345963 RepID=UPI003691FA1C